MRIAALDLGSNSFHLLVADATGAGALTPVVREKEMLRLGTIVAREGRITPAAADAAVTTLRRFRALADAARSDELVARATSAIREAANRQEFLDRVAAETGIALRVIDGDTEARLIFEAVRRSVVLEPPPALCLDLGGGSLEATIGDFEGARSSDSLPLGVARLTAELVREDPPSRGDLKRVRKRVLEGLAPVVEAAERHPPRMLLGTSGTLTDLAAAAVARRSGALPASLNQLVVARDDLLALHDDLVAATTAQRQRVEGMDARRAPVVVAGSVLLHAVIDRLGLDRLTIGEWALREGMVLDLVAARRAVDPPDEPVTPRRQAVLELCARYGWPEEHSRLVAALALRRFDGTQELHGLNGVARELLEYGALLHDIGEHVSTRDQAQHSAYLIEHGRLRGFDPGEVAMLACLGRYHRKGEPGEDFTSFGLLSGTRRRRVVALVGLLQVAHGLDHARTRAVTDLAVSVSDDTVTVAVATQGDGHLERWGAEQRGKRFAKALGRRLAVTSA